MEEALMDHQEIVDVYLLRDQDDECVIRKNLGAAKVPRGRSKIGIIFEQYVKHMIETEDENPYSDPVCMFPHWNAECYVDRRDPKFGCLNCVAARESYEKLDTEWAKKYMKGEQDD